LGAGCPIVTPGKTLLAHVSAISQTEPSYNQSILPINDA
jgi:hypothetical protein